jgi:methylated-DNA-[protein]-cysteine S-methyltransferase
MTQPIFTKYIHSPLGEIEVSATNDYLTSILFVETHKKPSPRQEATQSHPPIIDILIQQLSEYFAGERQQFEVAIKHEGSVFQQLVWEKLDTIPYGKTISYLELSKRIGNVKAIRAVGTTNGNNKFTIIVPCHRVIGANGSLVGYGGDLWRKKWLLDHEAKHTGSYQLDLF